MSIRATPSGKLRHSPQSYYWLTMWLFINGSIGLLSLYRGFAPGGTWMVVVSSAAIFGYMFLLHRHKIWWTSEQLWRRAWEPLSIKSTLQTVRIDELVEISTAKRTHNRSHYGFDKFIFIGPRGRVEIFLGLHRREELEELLHLIRDTRPELFTNSNIIAFMNGEFADWWVYR